MLLFQLLGYYIFRASIAEIEFRLGKNPKNEWMTDDDCLLMLKRPPIHQNQERHKAVEFWLVRCSQIPKLPSIVHIPGAFVSQKV